VETQELIRELCVLADEEQDPEKLIKLARMILVLWVRNDWNALSPIDRAVESDASGFLQGS